MNLEGIHHISATTGDARGTVEFYTDVLGLRLVAKSVNQDEPSVYHLFFSDEVGSPGADITFFEYPGARPGRPGAGMVHRIVWQVGSDAAIDFWEERLAARGVATERATGPSLLFADPEGLRHELLVTDQNEPLSARHPEVPTEHALQGFAGVRAYSAGPDASVQVLEDVLGARKVADDTWELKGERRTGFIAFDPPPPTHPVQGAGTVHHVAWGTTAAEHPRWLDELAQAGIESTPQVDRHYFKAIYFREPGGILYEISDDEPGFTVDGPVEELGTRIILPPWYEPHREKIEAILTPLPDPRANWAGSPG